MRRNLPILNEEVELADDATLISKTNLEGIITYANDSFAHYSEFSKEELVGQSHNIIRHPDIPSWLFEKLWIKIKEGRIWKGLIKNRTKSGKYYWVNATITPIFNENGEITGYMSVRTKVKRESIQETEEYLKTHKKSIKKWKSFTHFFGQFTIKQRLYFLSFVLLLPMIFFLINLYNIRQEKIQILNNQSTGIEITNLFSKNLKLMMEHRGLISLYKNESKQEWKEKIIKNEVDSEKAILDLNLVLDKQKKSFQMDWKSIQMEWRSLQIDNNQMNEFDNFEKHTILIDKLFKLIHSVSDSYQLYINSEISHYYLVQISQSYIPELLENLGKIRGFVVTISYKKENDLSVKLQLSSYLSILKNRINHLDEIFRSAQKQLPQEKNVFVHEYEKMTKDLTDLFNQIEKEIIRSEKQTNLSPEFHYERCTQSINHLFEILHKNNQILSNQIHTDINKSSREQYAIIAFIILIILAAMSIQIVIIRSITSILNQSIENIKNMVKGGGNLRQTFDFGTKDELNVLFEWIHIFVFTLIDVINQVKQESDRIKNILETSMNITSRLMDISKEQDISTKETSIVINDISNTMESLYREVSDKSSNLKQVNIIIDSFVSSLMEVDNSINQFYLMTNEFKEKAELGILATLETKDKIDLVSQKAISVDRIVNLIDEISDKTNLLALNASIESARAGDAGRGFAVVAKEVSTLADQTATNTKSIKNLTSETKKAISQSVSSINSTYQVLKSFEENIKNIHTFTNGIAVSQKKQIEGSAIIQELIQDIAKDGEDTIVHIQKQMEASNRIIDTIKKMNEEISEITESSKMLVLFTEKLDTVGDTLRNILKTIRY